MNRLRRELSSRCSERGTWLLLSNLNKIIIIQTPYDLPCIPIIASQIKFLNSDPGESRMLATSRPRSSLPLPAFGGACGELPLAQERAALKSSTEFVYLSSRCHLDSSTSGTYASGPCGDCQQVGHLSVRSMPHRSWPGTGTAWRGCGLAWSARLSFFLVFFFFALLSWLLVVF